MPLDSTEVSKNGDVEAADLRKDVSYDAEPSLEARQAEVATQGIDEDNVRETQLETEVDDGPQVEVLNGDASYEQHEKDEANKVVSVESNVEDDTPVEELEAAHAFSSAGEEPQVYDDIVSDSVKVSTNDEAEKSEFNEETIEEIVTLTEISTVETVACQGEAIEDSVMPENEMSAQEQMDENEGQGNYEEEVFEDDVEEVESAELQAATAEEIMPLDSTEVSKNGDVKAADLQEELIKKIVAPVEVLTVDSTELQAETAEENVALIANGMPKDEEVKSAELQAATPEEIVIPQNEMAAQEEEKENEGGCEEEVFEDDVEEVKSVELQAAAAEEVMPLDSTEVSKIGKDLKQ